MTALSRRSLFALLGGAALAPQVVAAAPKLVNSFADYTAADFPAIARYTYTSHSLSYTVTRESLERGYGAAADAYVRDIFEHGFNAGSPSLIDDWPG